MVAGGPTGLFPGGRVSVAKGDAREESTVVGCSLGTDLTSVAVVLDSEPSTTEIIGRGDVRLEPEPLDAATCEGLADDTAQTRSLLILLLRQIFEHDAADVGGNPALDYLRWTATRVVNMLLGDAVLFADSLTALAPSLVLMALGEPGVKHEAEEGVHPLGHEVQVAHLQLILAEGPATSGSTAVTPLQRRPSKTVSEAEGRGGLSAGVPTLSPQLSRSRSVVRTWQEVHTATKSNRVEALQTMLTPDTVDLTDPSNGDNPIHIAAENGHLEIVKMLVKLHANLDAQNGTGETALHFSVENDHDDVVLLLLDNDADPKLKNSRGFAAGTGVTGDKTFKDPGRDYVSANDPDQNRADDAQFESTKTILTELMNKAEHSKQTNDKAYVAVSPNESLQGRAARLLPAMSDVLSTSSRSAARRAMVSLVEAWPATQPLTIEAFGSLDRALGFITTCFNTDTGPEVIEAMLEQCLRTDDRTVSEEMGGESQSALAGHVATFALDQLWASLQEEREKRPVRKAVAVTVESPHPLPAYYEKYWPVSIPGAKYIEVVFDEWSSLDAACDNLTIYDDDCQSEVRFQVPGGRGWPGVGPHAPLEIAGDSMGIKCCSTAGTGACWGFKATVHGIVFKPPVQPPVSIGIPSSARRKTRLGCFLLNILARHMKAATVRDLLCSRKALVRFQAFVKRMPARDKIEVLHLLTTMMQPFISQSQPASSAIAAAASLSRPPQSDDGTPSSPLPVPAELQRQARVLNASLMEMFERLDAKVESLLPDSEYLTNANR